MWRGSLRPGAAHGPEKYTMWLWCRKARGQTTQHSAAASPSCTKGLGKAKETPRATATPWGQERFPLPACGTAIGSWRCHQPLFCPAVTTRALCSCYGLRQQQGFPQHCNRKQTPILGGSTSLSVPSFSSPCHQPHTRAVFKNMWGVCSDFQPPGCTSQSSCLADAVLTRCLTGTSLRRLPKFTAHFRAVRRAKASSAVWAQDGKMVS